MVFLPSARECDREIAGCGLRVEFRLPFEARCIEGKEGVHFNACPGVLLLLARWDFICVRGLEGFLF